MDESLKSGKTFVLILCLLFGFGHSAAAMDGASLRSIVKRNISNGCVKLNDESGETLFSFNVEEPFVPASIIKILTAQAAFDILGKDYRFRTGFFTDGKGNLAIRGWGDPFLISEEIEQIATVLKHRGISTVRSFYLDISAFSGDMTIPGTSGTLNPYDALNGALAVNFNTVNIGRTKEGILYSAEEETPLTPLAVEKGELIAAGTEERINLTDDPRESLRYVTELFTAFLRKAGVRVLSSDFKPVVIDRNWSKIYEHMNSRSLEDILTGLMKYSNNYIANQIFLTIGARKSGYPATLERSREVFRSYVKEKWGDRADEIRVDEASGISRRNSMTCSAMMAILETFRPWAKIIDEKRGNLVKSGTLTGVYNFAGYIKTDQGLRPYVIMMNQERNGRNGVLEQLRRFDTP